MKVKTIVGMVLLLMLCPAFVSEQGSPAPSGDAVLRVRTKNGQAVFQAGEVIPLQLSFTATTSNQYQLNMANYDHSGRMNYERFEVFPQAGWSDPLADYFGSGGVYIGGGLTSFRALSTNPLTIDLQLNEWVRFDQPGNYSVRITSSRIGGPGIVSSNDLAVTIVPARPEWQATVLRDAINIIDAAPASLSATMPEPVLDAVKKLRYLGTPEAAREMSRRIRGRAWDGDFKFGVFGSPSVAAGVAELERLLGDPDFPVTSGFLATLSMTALQSRNSKVTPDERSAVANRYRAQFQKAVVGKNGEALAVSLSTIFEEAAIHSGNLPGDQTRELSVRLASVFALLPLETQGALLEYRWSALDPKAMLAILPELARRVPDSQASASEREARIRISALAFRRWHELSPDAARAAMIEEILRPVPRFGSETLGVLSDPVLPAAESVLMKHLIQARGNLDASDRLSSLIERYATRAVESQVLALLDPILGKGPCVLQNNLFAYVLRVDVEAARSRLEKGLAARGKEFTGCYRTLLTEVGKRHSSPLLQKLARKGLMDTDSAVVSDARNYLANLAQ